MKPPASLLLVHGAGSGPWVFVEWLDSFPTLTVEAVDLQDGLAVDEASMSDYALRAVAVARGMPQPVALCGWSMGGLVVLQAAQDVEPHSVVLLEASAPAEIQGVNPMVQLVDGSFDPEAEYGKFPNGVRARPESVRARADASVASRFRRSLARRSSSPAPTSPSNAGGPSRASTAPSSWNFRSIGTSTSCWTQRRVGPSPTSSRCRCSGDIRAHRPTRPPVRRASGEQPEVPHAG